MDGMNTYLKCSNLEIRDRSKPVGNVTKIYVYNLNFPPAYRYHETSRKEALDLVLWLRII